MTALSNCGNRLAGTVKFEKGFPMETLTSLVRELKENHPESWVDLHVRSAGSGTCYIAFHRILKDGKKKTEKRASHKIIGFLRHRLGTRIGTKDVPNGVTGWSMSGVMLVA